MAKPTSSATTAHTKSTASQEKPPTAGWKLDLLALGGFYAAMLALFYPLILLGKRMPLTPDALAASAMNRCADLVMQTSSLPLWNPYLFSGMPLFAGYQFGLFVNPMWYLTKPITFLFGGEAAVILSYMVLGALGIYFVIRQLGETRILAFVGGMTWMWMPALVALPGVGHGSKLMSSAVLPWMLWSALRILQKASWRDTGILAVLCGVGILSLHTQITYYGFLMIGLIAVWGLVWSIKDKQPLDGIIKAAQIGIASALGAGISMVLSYSVLKFVSASSRGASGGGVDWAYATEWSFHPLESITFLWSTFYGSGGQTYWGHMRFTDMPLTFSVAALIGAALAVWLKRDRTTWLLLTIALFAWGVSWGKFLPVLFKPMFELMPMFKKFRVPSLIIILTQLAMIVLAARGYGAAAAMVDRTTAKQRELFRKLAYGGGALFVAFLVIAVMMSGSIKAAFVARTLEANPGVTAAQIEPATEEVWNVVFLGGLRSFIIVAALGFLVWMLVKGNIKLPVLASVILVSLALEFMPIIHNSNHPLISYSESTEFDDYFAPTPRVQFLKQQQGLFRVLPNDRSRSINWWGAQGLQSAAGYSGVKLGAWDQLEKSEAMNNPSVWRALNIKYLAMDRKVNVPWLREVAQDREGVLYEMPAPLDRAYFGLQTASVKDRAEALERMSKPDWDPSLTTLVEGAVPASEVDSSATAQITKWSNEQIAIKTNRAKPGVLVLSEIVAPNWEVTVNGQAAQALTVNGVLRGVAVPAGSATVEWTYQEGRIFKKGLMITIASSIAALLLILGGWWMERKRATVE